MSGSILVLSGPSGAGKSTIINQASDKIGEYYFSISSTSREPRAGEKHGREYYFLSKAEFEEGIKAGEFLEYAIVHGNYYGTSLGPVYKALEAGKLVIFDIDVQGYHLAKNKMGDMITSAFILPPSLSALEDRLRARSTDRESVIDGRIENAKKEILELSEYDFVIVNDDIESAAKQFISVANASRLKKSNIKSDELIKRWLNS